MEETPIDIKLKELLNKLTETQLIRLILGFEKPKPIKVPALAEEIGASKDNVYDWRDGGTPTEKFAHVKGKLIDYFLNSCKPYLSQRELEILIQKLENPVDQFEFKLQNLLREPKIDYEQNEVFVSIFFMTYGNIKTYREGRSNAGTIKHIEGEPALIALKRESFYTGDISGVVPFYEECMEPVFKKGALIGIRLLQYKEKYNSGIYYYVIDSNFHCMVRKVVRVSEDTCKLVPENNMVDIEIKKIDDILAIFKIEGDFNKR